MEFQRLPTGWQKTAAFRRNYRLTEARIKLSLTTVPFVMVISNAAGNVFFPFFIKLTTTTNRTNVISYTR